MATPTSLPATFTSGQVLTAAQMNDLRGAFRILQVASTTKTDTYSASVAGTSFSSNVTGLEVTITPSATSSKILVCAVVQAAQDTNYSYMAFRLMRDATPVGIGDSAGSRSQVSAVGGANAHDGNDIANMTTVLLDSPNTTSAVTYGVQVHNRGSTTRTLYVNRSSIDADTVALGRPVSSITVLEVSA